MKITKKQLIKLIQEQTQTHHFFGPSSSDERETGIANNRMNDPFVFNGRFKNGYAFLNYLKKYYLKNDLNKLSNGFIKIIPGNKHYLTFWSNGFDKKNVENIFKPIIIKFKKVEGIQLELTEFKKNSFVLEFNQ